MAALLAPEKIWTTEDLLAMPDDGIRRWIYHGRMYEQLPDDDRGEDMTVRNRFHSKTMANITALLTNWRWLQPEPRGDVVCGEAGVRFPGQNNTIGVDVAYVPPDVVMEQTEDSTIICGVPTLIVEILSPSDKLQEIDLWLASYREAGVPLVWVVSTNHQTVTIYRPGEEPTFVNSKQELTGEDVLTGFRVPVAKLFA